MLSILAKTNKPMNAMKLAINLYSRSHIKTKRSKWEGGGGAFFCPHELL